MIMELASQRWNAEFGHTYVQGTVTRSSNFIPRLKTQAQHLNGVVVRMSDKGNTYLFRSFVCSCFA
jgi:hypothetical protein